jgi:hypothetical protein
MDSDNFAESFFWNTAQAIFAPIFENKLNRRSEVLTTLFNRAALAIRTRNLRRPGHEPIAITLNDRCEFVVHTRIIAPQGAGSRVFLHPVPCSLFV